jgi:1,6-anhydro-N-acetylmuramate kinase
VLRPQRFTSNQIQDVLRQFAKLGINTVAVGKAEETLLARSARQTDVAEEPKGGPLIPIIHETMNDQSLPRREKLAFALGLLRGLSARAG